MVITVASPDEMMAKGLVLVGYSPQRQARVRRAENVRCKQENASSLQWFKRRKCQGWSEQNYDTGSPFRPIKGEAERMEMGA